MEFLFGIKKRLIAIVIISGFLALIYFQRMIPDNYFHIYFLDVGQGDAIFIKTPENHQILVDGGDKDYVIEELSEIMPFFDRTIDFMVLTHPHSDHIGGLIEVLKRFKVENILYTGVYFDDDMYSEFLKEINASGGRIFLAEASTDFRFGEVYLDILYPFSNISGQRFSNINNSSVAMRVVYGGRAVFLGGDIEKEVEEKLLLSGENLWADILKVSHHGSKSSSMEEFLGRVGPEIAVIEAGRENKFGHPHAVTIRSLLRSGVDKIFRTDENGRVEIIY